MDRLRKTYLALGTVLVPVATAYLFHVAQNPESNVGRAEAALRAAISVGAVIWVVMWTVHCLAVSYAAAVRYQVSGVASTIEASDRDRDLQMVKMHDAIVSVREDSDRELKTSMSWVIQRLKDIDPRS